MEDEYAIPENPFLLNFMGVVLLFLFLNHVISKCFIIGKEVEIKDEPIEKEPTIIVKYEDKYKGRYDKLEHRDLSTEEVEKLKNSILLETTPLGNVLLFYDHSRETFTYYSDNTIPYRFLETVSRKYVIQNNCKSLYVNMEQELNSVEEKKKLESEKKEVEKEKQIEEPEKKSVFAKLKSYNKNTGLQSSGKPGPKPGPEKNAPDTSIVKEKANRYSYEGKMANYSFLKKVDRKVVDKQYSITFAEFKKLNASSFIEK